MKEKEYNSRVIAVIMLLCFIFFAYHCWRINQYRNKLDAAEIYCEQLRDERDGLELCYDMLSSDYNYLFHQFMKQKDVDKQIIAIEPYPNYEEWGFDFDYVVRVVGAEARGEPFEGIMAVAQCIRTTAEKTGMTPEEVVKVPGQYASPVSHDCTDNMETVNEACLLVFGEGQNAVDDEIERFCSTTSNSAYHNSLRYVCTIGHHNFYALH